MMSVSDDEQTEADADERRLNLGRHVCQIAVVVVYASLILGWLATHTAVVFADGLRYIKQAKVLESGATDAGIRGSVDHPIYPLAIAAAHWIEGGEGPLSWQGSAQVASILASLLLIVPLYLISRELFGDRVALPACLLVFTVPAISRVFADGLSESTFLLFWSWGLWGSLRFLRDGQIRYLPLIIAGSACAYLTRPEGLLLPAAMVATLVLSPKWVFSRLPGTRAAWALGSIPIALGLIVGPYVAIKGGIGTKPSIARLLGTAPKSDKLAVERQRPLEEDETAAETLGQAIKVVNKSITEAISWPLVPFALLGLLLALPRGAAARQWTLLGVIGVASFLALLRLFSTGGYCTSRHALIIALTAIPVAAFGLDRVMTFLVDYVKLPLARPLRAVALPVLVLAMMVAEAPRLIGRLNPAYGGYRTAGDWLAENTDESSHVVDVTGWSQFYSGKPGFTFADLDAAPGDPEARWVVVREAHLRGPWLYCKKLSALVEGLEPVETFAGTADHHATHIYLFDRQSKLQQAAISRPESAKR